MAESTLIFKLKKGGTESVEVQLSSAGSKIAFRYELKASDAVYLERKSDKHRDHITGTHARFIILDSDKSYSVGLEPDSANAEVSLTPIP